MLHINILPLPVTAHTAVRMYSDEHILGTWFVEGMRSFASIIAIVDLIEVDGIDERIQQEFEQRANDPCIAWEKYK